MTESRTLSDLERMRSVRSLDWAVFVLALISVAVACVPGIGFVMWFIGGPMCLVIAILGIVMLMRGGTWRGIFTLLFSMFALPLVLAFMPLVSATVAEKIEIRKFAQEEEKKRTEAADTRKKQEAAAAIARTELDRKMSQSILDWIKAELPGRDARPEGMVTEATYDGSKLRIVRLAGRDNAGQSNRIYFVFRFDTDGNVKDAGPAGMWIESREAELKKSHPGNEGELGWDLAKIRAMIVP